MKSKLSTLGFVLILSALIVSGCGTGTVQPTEAPTEVGAEAPDEVRAARDAALAYVGEQYGEQAPAPGLAWTEENITPGWPEAPVPGWMEYRFIAEDWGITIGYAVLPPERTVYQVAVTNRATGFQWEGEVDASGQVRDPSDPATDPVVVPDPAHARDAALRYIFEQYGEQVYPPPGMDWLEENITPEGLVGSVTFQYTTEDWVVTISYPIVPPEQVVYQAVVASQTTGFQWEGEVNAALQVTETLTPIGGQPVVGWMGRVVSLPASGQFDDYLALEPEGAGAVGIEGADNTVAAQIQMLRDSTTYAHFWGTLTCPVLDYGGCQLVVTRLREARPGPAFDPDPVEGWGGTIVGFPWGSQFDDYFRLAGDFPVGYGIESLDPAIAAQLQEARDTGATIRVWGELVCPAIDAFGTEVVVNRVEVVGEPVPAPPPAPEPTPVENWYGEIVSYPPGSQYDDYFQRQIVNGGQYGIESRDPEIQAQIVALRDTGTTVHVWGTLYHDVPDVNGTQILVTRLEVQEPPAPPDVTEEPVEGWIGTIVKLPFGTQFDTYFERNDGQRFDIWGMTEV